MPIFVAPAAGLLSTRTGTRPLIVTGLALQALALGWLSVITTPTTDYLLMVPAFVVAGTGMGLFFAPIANVVLSAVRPEEEGKASGANNAIRELGGVFGVAVLASVFTANGSYATPQAFVDGMIPALQLGAGVVAVGAVAALAIRGRARNVVEVPADDRSTEFEPAAA
jgi:MFS family permease